MTFATIPFQTATRRHLRVRGVNEGLAVAEHYKKGEATLTRRIAFYGLLILIFWGFKEFASTARRWVWGRTNILDGFKFEVPFFEQPLTWGVLFSVVGIVVCSYYAFKILNRPATADTLIDTETEMRKVAWPTWDDARQSTVIVLAFVAATAFFLFVSEFALARVFNLIFVS